MGGWLTEGCSTHGRGVTPGKGLKLFSKECVMVGGGGGVATIFHGFRVLANFNNIRSIRHGRGFILSRSTGRGCPGVAQNETCNKVSF